MVRSDGVGPLKVGMTIHQLRTALNENFSLPKDKDEQGCFYVNPSKHPKLNLMILGGRFARVDVDERGTLTSEGIQIGNTEAHAKRVYGHKLKITPHAYTAPEGHYLTVLSKHGAYGIRFETDHGKIVRLYAVPMLFNLSKAANDGRHPVWPPLPNAFES
jgi:hypothetical protein